MKSQGAKLRIWRLALLFDIKKLSNRVQGQSGRKEKFDEDKWSGYYVCENKARGTKKISRDEESEKKKFNSHALLATCTIIIFRR